MAKIKTKKNEPFTLDFSQKICKEYFFIHVVVFIAVGAIRVELSNFVNFNVVFDVLDAKFYEFYDFNVDNIDFLMNSMIMMLNLMHKLINLMFMILILILMIMMFK